MMMDLNYRYNVLDITGIYKGFEWHSIRHRRVIIISKGFKMPWVRGSGPTDFALGYVKLKL